MNKYEVFIKPDYNFIHWLNDEPNNYKGEKFWFYFAIKETKIQPNGLTINFYIFNETGKPHVSYHYYNKEFSLNGMWRFWVYDNLCAAWRYITIPIQFESFSAAVNSILEFYNKKVNYLCGQVLC